MSHKRLDFSAVYIKNCIVTLGGIGVNYFQQDVPSEVFKFASFSWSTFGEVVING